MSSLKNIALVGANGNVGGPILKHLLAANKGFNITVLSRPESKAQFDASVKVVRASYDDKAALTDAFKGQDIVIFCLAAQATMEQPKLISAAAAAGVKWFIPNEYAGDGTNEMMVDNVMAFQPKREARKQIETAGGKWIGICTGPWPETSLKMSMLFGIDVLNKKAETWEGMGNCTMSTLPRVGEAVAKVLSMPASNSGDESKSLEHYANKFVYVSSFTTTQQRVIEAVQKATGSSAADWTIQKHDYKRLDNGLEMAKQGADMRQVMGETMFGAYLQEGAGGDVETYAKADREVFGLSEEDIDEVVAKVVKDIEESGPVTWG